MFKEITDVFNWLNNAGVFAFLVVLIPAVYKLVKPLLTRKVQTGRNTHVKQALEVGLNLANTIVPEMAVMAGLSLSDRKKEAIRFVNAQLTANGFDLDVQNISGLVEKAYQAYKVASGLSGCLIRKTRYVKTLSLVEVSIRLLTNGSTMLKTMYVN